MKAKLFIIAATILTSFFTAFSVSSTPAMAACPPDNLLGIPAWYSGLQENPAADKCDIRKVGQGGMDVRAFAVKVALNIIRAALVIVGYIAVFFIIRGGFLYMMAQGEPANLTNAKQSITNAIIGLIIALLSAAIVAAVSGVIN